MLPCHVSGCVTWVLQSAVKMATQSYCVAIVQFILLFLAVFSEGVSAFDGGDAAALILGLFIGIMGIFACLGWYARRRSASWGNHRTTGTSGSGANCKRGLMSLVKSASEPWNVNVFVCYDDLWVLGLYFRRNQSTDINWITRHWKSAAEQN